MLENNPIPAAINTTTTTSITTYNNDNNYNYNLKLWDTNGSPNLGQTTRPSDIQQK